MAGARKRGEEIRRFIVEHVEEHPTDIVAITGKAFNISRQAVNKHMNQLLTEKALIAEGTTRNRHYRLQSILRKDLSYELAGLKEDVVWRNDIAPLLSELPKNVRAIWQHGITEMLNNAIDHSSGKELCVNIEKTPRSVQVLIFDDGEGIFEKIRRELHLDDEYHSILELAKGKLTTDPEHHSGEGIFFSSRMFDRFGIHSGDLFFKHDIKAEFDLLDRVATPLQGTVVGMKLKNNTTRTTKEVFDAFSDDEYSFTKTVVPVRLAQYGDEMLVSRSQAKRVLARIDRFKTVIFDFESVDEIGQAFADQVFRVFANAHPEIELTYTNENARIRAMINRARSLSLNGLHFR